jgi:hypothetical protein
LRTPNPHRELFISVEDIEGLAAEEKARVAQNFPR